MSIEVISSNVLHNDVWRSPITNDWPSQARASMNAFYGNPDADGNGQPDRAWEDSNLVYVTPPYPMVLSWDTKVPVSKIRVNRRCAASLLRVLEKVMTLYGSDETIRKARMHLFGGCYSFRLKRKGSSLSTHSWGAAIDFDPGRNEFGRRYNAQVGMMPKVVVDLFGAEGWTWGGLWTRPDTMHFQAADI